MPGIPLVARETAQSRSADQMCCQGSRPRLSAEEEIAAEESLSAYCKPVELYNILQRRAIRNPLFLQRSLRYKIEAKHDRRVQMTISLSGTLNDGLLHNLLPLRVMLARMISGDPATECSAVYQLTRQQVLTTSSIVGVNLVQVKFILPEMSRLGAEIQAGSIFVFFVSDDESSSLHELDTSKSHFETSAVSACSEKHCLLGRIPMESLFFTWEKSPNLSLGERAEMMSTVDMHPCFMKPGCLDKDSQKTFQIRYSSSNMSSFRLVQVIIAAEVSGAKEKSAYDSYTCSNVPTSSLSHILRLRTGNVVFNYRYYNNKLQRTEVTEDFSCPFCLVRCASFKGLRYHLPSSHDLFKFEFWVTQEYQAVNVSVRSDSWRSEIVADGVDPKRQTFLFCSKPLRRRKLEVSPCDPVVAKQLASALDFPPGAGDEFVNKADDAYSSKGGRAHSSSGNDSQTAGQDPESIQSISGNHIVPPAVLQFAKTRKLSDRSDHRNRANLEKRQFFHSHRAQPMALEQVLSDRDSEDEVDDDVADLEDRRMLDDFVDVTKDEKQIMHFWNSFVRKQRVLADGHIPWACEAFSRLHGHDLIRSPSLVWCWRLFMIKLWNHGLLDARTMNNCNFVLEEFQTQQTTDV